MSPIDPAIDRCTRSNKDSKIKVEANGRKATFLNPGHVKIKIVDLDCLLASRQVIRADHIVSKPGFVDVIVELKGKDLKHAEQQILRTLQHWKAAIPFSPQFGGLIIFSRSPENAAAISDMKKRMLEQHGLWLELNKSGQTEYDFKIFRGEKA